MSPLFVGRAANLPVFALPEKMYYVSNTKAPVILTEARSCRMVKARIPGGSEGIYGRISYSN